MPVTLAGDVSFSGDCVGTADTCTVVPDAPVHVAARQVPQAVLSSIGVNLEISVSGKVGLVTGARYRCRPKSRKEPCEQLFQRGTSVPLRASPPNRFVRWDGACRGRNPRCTVRVSSQTIARAVFRR